MQRIEHGFSLVELLIVVTILGIAALVVVPDISTTDPGKLELAAKEFAQAMRYARSEAIRTGEPRGFRQQSATKRIRLFSADTGTSPWTLNYDVHHPLSKKLYDIDLNTHPFALADGLSRSASFIGSCNTSGDIYFNSDGVPYCTDPDNVIVKQLDVKFVLGSHARVVTLNGITGRVSVQ